MGSTGVVSTRLAGNGSWCVLALRLLLTTSVPLVGQGGVDVVMVAGIATRFLRLMMERFMVMGRWTLCNL